MDRPADGGDALARAHEYLAASPFASRVAGVVPLDGDASDRRYLRVHLSDGGSLVLALYAAPPETGTRHFARVAQLFRQLSVPVPAILDQSETLGVLALEDLGDTTLQTHLPGAGPEEVRSRYREAATMIATMQRRGAEVDSPARYPPYQLAFDVEKLTAELDFFVRHFLEAERQVVLAPSEREALAGEWRQLAAELAAEPRVLCHRDFHSRNLMVHRGRLYTIDFQDARLGPDTYDLASLLRDSYTDPGDALRDDVLTFFLGLENRTDGPEFRRRFDLVSVQRNLKALGTFGFQSTSRGNRSYLGNVPRTLGYLRATLRAERRFSRLLDLLSSHLDELR